MKILLLVALSLLGPSVFAGQWEVLGKREVKIRAERDVIQVTAKEGKFSKIKLKVRRNGVRFIDLKVHYGNGDVQDIQLRKFIPAGGETRVIDLSGRKRVIKKVSFTYKTETKGRRKGRAVVTLLGKH
ncbi:MAG: hypothetical protein QNK37_00830 [Acidobacteriota bacterium]|nr:hypothetical protein [Acidobacteriota bacterium]